MLGDMYHARAHHASAAFSLDAVRTAQLHSGTRQGIELLNAMHTSTRLTHYVVITLLL